MRARTQLAGIDSRTAALFAAVSLMSAACGDVAGDELDMLDLRVDIPEPDDQFIDLITPEVVIESGEERMYCLHLEHEGPDVAIQALSAQQGDSGHHIVLIRASENKPPGTLEDCTNAESVQDMIPLALPIPLPDGHAIRLRTGQRYVMQFHYINVRTVPILIRDIARLQKIAMQDVSSWVSTFATNNGSFEVLPGDASVVQWDCTLERDLEVILVGGHMHELGSSFTLEAGSDEETMRTLYTVPTWLPDYRDLPPIVPLFESPASLPAGTVLRTRCTWREDNERTIEFPEEMCASFGYIRSEEPYFCSEGGGL